MCPRPAIAFVAGSENKHFGQIWSELNVAASVDTCSMIHYHDYVTIMLQGPKSGVTKALQKLSRCLMNYNPMRDPHNTYYRGGSSRYPQRTPAPYRPPSSYRSRVMRRSPPRESTTPVNSKDDSEEIELHPKHPIDDEDGEIVTHIP